MPTITLGQKELPYLLTFSKRRRTLQIKIAPPGTIEVLAPHNFPLGEVENILQKRSTWITTQLAKLDKLTSNPVNTTFSQGSQVLFLGRPREMTFVPASGKRAKVLLADYQLIIHLPADRLAGQDIVSKALHTFYLRSAATLLTERTNFWAQEIGVRPQKISLRAQKTRWGSASPRGNINYNWHIVMAPLEVVDYLVVHELCHMKVPNHSAAFWQLVGQFVPAFKQHRLWLRQNGTLLTRLFSQP
jgi:hypothetical protein